MFDSLMFQLAWAPATASGGAQYVRVHLVRMQEAPNTTVLNVSIANGVAACTHPVGEGTSHPLIPPAYGLEGKLVMSHHASYTRTMFSNRSLCRIQLYRTSWQAPCCDVRKSSAN